MGWVGRESGRRAYAGRVSISERASAGSDVGVLADRSWGTRSHRETLAELVLLGWTPCGVGDWAIALRSPGGRLAARICPFDPAYSAFLELCRRCAGSRYLPHVDLTAALEGGGSLTVLEFLAPAQEAAAAELIRQWKQDEGDAELSMVKAAALAVDEDYRARRPSFAGSSRRTSVGICLRFPTSPERAARPNYARCRTRGSVWSSTVQYDAYATSGPSRSSWQIRALSSGHSSRHRRLIGYLHDRI